ncbi:MAG: hypothetical protein ACFFB2_01695 [Promethearchaeota archaeon]
MRSVKQCQYCGRVLTDYSTLTILWSYIIARDHPRRAWFEGYCSGGCLTRDRMNKNPLKPFMISMGLILVAFVIFSYYEFYNDENLFPFWWGFHIIFRSLDLFLSWIIGNIILIYGFFSLFVNIYYFFSERLRSKSEKISIEHQIRDVEHDLDTAKQEINARNFKDAIARLKNLESNLLLTPDGKKRMRSLLAQCYFQQKDYPDAYYNLQLLARQSQLTINDYIRKIQCESYLDLPQQRHQTLEEAFVKFPGHPELKVLMIEKNGINNVKM